MTSFPSLEGLSWPRIRALARELAVTATPEDLASAAESLLPGGDSVHRQLAVYLLGCTSPARPENLTLLRERAVLDPSWEVQEVLAQAFDAFCAAIGYEAAVPTIDQWLADAQPNARRAVSEGLRPWTSQRRPYFARNPGEAIRRLAALRRDPSEYVRHSAGNALRDVRRSFPGLVDAETVTWNLSDPGEGFTYRRVLKAR